MRIDYHRYGIYLLYIVIVTINACKIPKINSDIISRKIPDSFPVSTANTGAKLPAWRNYFKDSLLTNLIDSALSNNPDLQITLQRVEMAANDLKQAKGALLPTVGANVAFQHRKFGYYTMDDAGNRTTYIMPGRFVPTYLPDYFAGFQTSWEADIWGKLKSRKNAAKARFFSSMEGVHIAVTTLVSDVSLTYFELQALDQELSIIRQAILLQQAALEVVKLQKDASVTTELAVKQFEAQVLNTRSLEYKTIQQIIIQENKLNLLLGRFGGSIARSKLSAENSLADSAVVGLPSALLVNRPDIRQAEHELTAAGFDLQAARRAFYPSLTLTGFAGMQSFKTGFLLNFPKSLAYNMLSGMTAPMLNRTAIKAQYRNASARQQEAALKYRRTVIQGYLEVATELSNIANLRAYTQYKTQEVSALNQSVTISDDLFRTGKATYLEVLMIQHNALLSGLEMTEAEKYKRQAFVNLYKALGGGWQ